MEFKQELIMPDLGKLKATPEVEDFAHKYTEEGEGKIGGKLIDNYFRSVTKLVADSKVTERTAATAIELGCGEGFSTERLRTMLPAQVRLEASEFVEALVPKAQERNPQVTVRQESVYEIKAEDNTYDLIFLLEVMEHLDYPDVALKEIARVLKPDGYLVLGVPREPLWRCLNMARGKYIKDLGNTPGHLNHWSSRALRHFVGEHFGPVVVLNRPLPWTQVLAKKR